MSAIVELKSGRKLAVAVAPLADANKLRKVVLAELAAVEIDPALRVDAKMLALDIKDMNGAMLSTMKNVLCRLLSSDAIEAAFFQCAQRCTLDGIKVTRDTFEPENMRGEMLPVAQEVIRANIAPFFENLDFGSLIGAAAQTSAPPSG